MPTVEELLDELLGAGEQTPLERYFTWINRLYSEGAITLEDRDLSLRQAERITALKTGIPLSRLPHGEFAFVEDPKAQRTYIDFRKKVMVGEKEAVLIEAAAKAREAVRPPKEAPLRELPITEPEAAREISPNPSAREAALPFLQRLPPSAKEYFESQLGRLYADPIAEAMAKWWRALQPSAPPTIGRPWEAMTPEERGAKMVLGQRYGYEDYGEYTGEMMAAGYADISEYEEAKARAEETGLPLQRGVTPAERPTRKRAFEIERGLRAEERVRPAPPPIDPLVTELREYPFLSEWIKRPPRQRGFYPGRLAPRARWGS